MKPGLRLLGRLYEILLRLYPSRFRCEYGAELQTVFSLALEVADRQGGLEIGRLVWRELLDLPGAVIREHLRARRKEHMTRKWSAFLHFAPGSGREFLTALYPFTLLGAVLPLVNLLGQTGLIQVPNPWLDGLGRPLLLSVFGVLLLAGLFNGLPRWWLPNAGLMLAVLSVYGISEWIHLWNLIPIMSLYSRSWFLGQVAYQGSLWVGLTLVMVPLVWLSAWVPALRRFKNDWTLLAFLLYGVTPFALVATFDDYVHEELYELSAFLILAGGAWIYLHAKTNRARFAALFGAMSGALFLAAGAKAALFASPSWPFPRRAFEWQTELLSTLIMWGWIALSLLVPLALHWRPRAQAGQPAEI